jgi:hypothetical protein
LWALRDEHSEDHTDRNAFVIEHHSDIHRFYRELYNLSRLARYGIGPHHWLLPGRVTDCPEEIQKYVADHSE